MISPLDAFVNRLKGPYQVFLQNPASDAIGYFFPKAVWMHYRYACEPSARRRSQMTHLKTNETFICDAHHTQWLSKNLGSDPNILSYHFC